MTLAEFAIPSIVINMTLILGAFAVGLILLAHIQVRKVRKDATSTSSSTPALPPIHHICACLFCWPADMKSEEEDKNFQVCLCMYICMSVCVCVCVCERERERERE